MTQERCGERNLESSLMIASLDISEGFDGWYFRTVAGTAHFGNDNPCTNVSTATLHAESLAFT